MRIELAPDIERRFNSSLQNAGKREIGGMLLAEQLAPSYFRVVDFSLDAFSGSHMGFRRDPRTHQHALDEFFQRTSRDFQRFNYLGEWHSHPSFSVQPSVQDIQAMTDIVESGNSIITFAVLLIVRLRFRFWVEHSLTIFARGRAPELSRIGHRVKVDIDRLHRRLHFANPSVMPRAKAPAGRASAWVGVRMHRPAHAQK